MIGWFFFSFFSPPLIQYHGNNSDWLAKLLCLNGKCETVLQRYKRTVSSGLLQRSVQQVQANTLAQLGSNPLKPLLRATADPATPPEGSENGSILERKPLHFILLSPQIKNRVIGMEVSQFLPCPSILQTWIALSKCTVSYSGNKQPQCFLNIMREGSSTSVHSSAPWDYATPSHVGDSYISLIPEA